MDSRREGLGLSSVAARYSSQKELEGKIFWAFDQYRERFVKKIIILEQDNLKGITAYMSFPFSKVFKKVVFVKKLVGLLFVCITVGCSLQEGSPNRPKGQQ